MSSIHHHPTTTGRRIFSLRNTTTTTKQEAATRWQDLPEECWELVFDRLLKCHHHDRDHRRPYRHFESLSLVCKQFLSISNRLRSSLNITDPLIILSRCGTTLSVILRRFHHLNRIDLVEFHGDLDLILTQLAQSRLNLQALDISDNKMIPEKGLKELGSKMKNSLKILRCARLQVLLGKDLVVIGDSLPYLEELDISFLKQDFRSYPNPTFNSSRLQQPPISDTDIVNLSSKLPKIGRFQWVSPGHLCGDQSVFTVVVLAWG